MLMTDVSKNIRRTIINMAHRSRAPHVGSALSCVDILSTLYFSVMRFEPWELRDIFILSKGHASMALYATLAERGIIESALLEGYMLNDGTLPAHVDRTVARGVEVSVGALGHGFGMGLGMAYGFKKQGNDRRVYVVMGDGESQEGSVWEGALFAAHLKLSQVTVFLDYNNLQGYGRPREICQFEPVADKWRAFGWHVQEVDGHNSADIQSVCANYSAEKPNIVIAHTIKGKGISYMEDQLVWHNYTVTDEHRKQALEELS